MNTPANMPQRTNQQTPQLDQEQVLRLARQNLNSRLRKITNITLRSATVAEILELNRLLDGFADWRTAPQRRKDRDQ